MTIALINAQQDVPVDVPRLARLARRAARTLGIRGRGRLDVTFIDARRMRALNKRFLRHDAPTDVLSFRYDGRPGTASGPTVAGEILIAPSEARAYAKRHGLSYEAELARYVIHGLLHWKGYEDKTLTQQRRMRALEDRLLDRCCQNGTVSL